MIRLRELREDAGLKLSDVAEMLGTHATAISKYELEQRQLTPELIAKFCALYHVSADYLLGLSDERTPPAAAEPVSDIQAMAEIISRFTPEQVELFQQLVRLITKEK